MNKRVIASLLILAVMSGMCACSSGSSETSEMSSSAVISTEVEETTTTAEETTEETTESVEEYTDFLQGHDTFILNSDDLVDGVWAEAITSTLNGESLSPELHWDEVEGASCYVVYMVNVSTTNFIHLKTDMITATSLAQGELSLTEYFGIHPEEGTVCTYDVYVVALANPVERVKGTLASPCLNFEEFINDLDVDIDGNSGNIIAYGRLSGSYSHA